MLNVILLGLLTLTFQLAAPSTAPSTQPSNDPASPKGALRLFAHAHRAYDYETLSRVSKTDWTDESEATLLAHVVALEKSFGDLVAAVRDKFGDQAARELVKNRRPPLEPFLQTVEKKLELFEAQERGDVAKLIYPHKPEYDTHIVLVREGGVWKVAATGVATEWGKDLLERRLQTMAERTSIVSGFAEDVRNSKYQDMDSLMTELRQAFSR